MEKKKKTRLHEVVACEMPYLYCPSEYTNRLRNIAYRVHSHSLVNLSLPFQHFLVSFYNNVTVVNNTKWQVG